MNLLIVDGGVARDAAFHTTLRCSIRASSSSITAPSVLWSWILHLAREFDLYLSSTLASGSALHCSQPATNTLTFG